MNMIATVDNNWGIGKNNHNLFYIQKDIDHFLDLTCGKAIIMGRNTLESFPKGKPLDHRANIILSKTIEPHREKNSIYVSSISDLVDMIVDISTKDIFVIGGEMVLGEMLEFCDTAYITKVNVNVDVDRFCPNLDEFGEWKIMEESESYSFNSLSYKFLRYERW